MNAHSYRGPMGAILVGILGAAISLARILVPNREALTTLVWAEDGLFPLCIAKADLFTCTLDPFAGYLLFVPRVLSWIPAQFPLESWALTTNLVAAGLAGVGSAVVFTIVRHHGVSLAGAVLVSWLPVLAPIVGLEAINSVGNSYMVLLYVAAIAVAFPPSSSRGVWFAAIGLCATALTVPTAVFLFIGILIQRYRQTLSSRQTLILAAGLGVGLMGQFAIVITADSPRSIAFVPEAASVWLDNVPSALLSFWPGMAFGRYPVFVSHITTPNSLSGLAIVLLGLGVSIWLMLRGIPRHVGIGVLMITGVLTSALPAVTANFTNRYVVWLALMWGAAALIEVDSHLSARSRFAMPLVAAALLLLWSPALPASAWRASPTWLAQSWNHGSPRWDVEVAEIRARCAADPAATVDVYFSPDWPTDRQVFSEPTTPTITCASVAR